MLSQRIREHNGQNCYDDSYQRDALVNLIHTDNEFREYIKEQFSITDEANTKICKDPLGDYKVDLGVKQNGELIGLIEVDYYIKWDPDWPENYRWCHALARKIKYWKEEGLPYIGCTLNKQGDKALVSTDEMQRKYMWTMKRKKVYLNNEWIDDKFIEIPLRVAKKFGNWTDDELRRVNNA